MRDIIFKAKRIANAEWVYGYLYKDKNDVVFIKWVEEKDGVMYDCQVEVKPETVCQQIGIQDKKGNELYENDKLNISVDGTEGFSAIIIYKTGRFITRCLCGCKQDFTYFSVPNKSKYMNMTLIGNKFDSD